MCRHLAYLGPPVTLADLVLDPPHSLYRQSWAPCDMRQGGTVNADGYGLAWYAGRELVRYRRSVPIWADESLPGLARSIRSGAVLAALRNGTTGMPLVETAVAPFTEGRWAFSHNGVVGGWPDSMAKLAERLPATDLITLDAPTDSALLWALVRHRLRAGEPAADAVRSVVAEVVAAAPESRLNLLLTDGTQIVATAWWHSLWVRRVEQSVAVSSEPWDPDDKTWQQVPDRQLLLATRETLEMSDLEGRQ
jgi:gamma-glutamyl hercynylcysteine S-oxide hydrolase